MRWFTVTMFARAMRVSYPVATGLINRMIKAGIIEKRPKVAGEDGRVKRYGFILQQ